MTHQRVGGPTLVLITGSGRSGTSSLAGCFKRLGFHVPQPEVEADSSNPRGFYEPRWAIEYHKAILRQKAVHNIDARPAAKRLLDDVQRSGEVANDIAAWLADQKSASRLVIKDPHAFWFADSWRTAAAREGIHLHLLTSIRRPAEVVVSRDRAYLQNHPLEVRRTKETANVAGWVHAALLTERAGRDGSRSFVRYTDLITNWRQALRRTQEQLALEFDHDLDDETPSSIDDFIDPALRQSAPGWDDIVVPDVLRELADRVWVSLETLVERPKDASAMRSLDDCYESYVTLFAESTAIAFDHTNAEVTMARREAQQVRRDDLRRLRERVRKQQTELTELRSAQPGKAGGLPRRVVGAIRRRAAAR